MMGKRKGGTPNFKAAETKHVLPFVFELLGSTPQIPEPLRAYLLGATEALISLIRIMDDSPAVLSQKTIASLHDAYKKYMRCAALAKIPMKPKNHLLGHMIHRAAQAGNPRMYSTFEDEGLNHVLKLIGAAAHRSVWEYRVFVSFEQWEDRASAKRRRV